MIDPVSGGPAPPPTPPTRSGHRLWRPAGARRCKRPAGRCGATVLDLMELTCRRNDRPPDRTRMKPDCFSAARRLGLPGDGPARSLQAPDDIEMNRWAQAAHGGGRRPPRCCARRRGPAGRALTEDDQVASLTRMIRAYEQGLAAARWLRRAGIREQQIRAEFRRPPRPAGPGAGVMTSMQKSPETMAACIRPGPEALGPAPA